MNRYHIIVSILGLCLVNLLLGNDAASAEPFLEKRDVFVNGTGNYHTYRKPAVVVTNEGTVLAICEAHRYNDTDMGDVDIVVKRSTDGGATWEGPQVVWDDAMQTCLSPTAVVDRQTGKVWVLMGMKEYPDTREDLLALKVVDQFTGTWRGYKAYLCHSADDGRTWSGAANVTEVVKDPNWRYFSPSSGIGIQLESGPHQGRLLIPCVLSAFGKHVGYPGFIYSHNIHDYGTFGAYVVYSDDHGATWQRSKEAVWPWMGAGQLVELADGRLMFNLTNYYRKHKCRAVSFSEDGGVTWSEAIFDETLVEPISQASLLRLTDEASRDRGRLLFANPAHPDEIKDLTVRLSYDEGESWDVAKAVEAGNAGNSSMAVLPDQTVILLHDHASSGGISLARFNLAWLTDGRDNIDNQE